MPDEKKALDWGDIVTRTVVPGLLIALVGFVSERTISSISSKQENARLRIGKTGCLFIMPPLSTLLTSRLRMRRIGPVTGRPALLASRAPSESPLQSCHRILSD